MSLVRGPRPDPASDLDVLARPGGNDQVVGKKVLLAKLAEQEVKRLGIQPDQEQIQEVTGAFLRELGLGDPASASAWLEREGFTPVDFDSLMADFAAVLAAEAHYKEQLTEPVELHRRLMAARARRLARHHPPR